MEGAGFFRSGQRSSIFARVICFRSLAGISQISLRLAAAPTAIRHDHC
jgi:hypothetical protein